MTTGPSPDIHLAAAQGFEKEAARYQRGRPDYPLEVTGWLRNSLGLAPGKTAVDLGAGTGRFTKWLVETGAGVSGIEPVAAMREQLTATLPAVEALPGTAESIPLPDNSVDTVVCAQAFHWFASTAALQEIRRILRPGGTLGLIWNVRDESVPWVAELAKLVEPYEAGAPRYASGAWRTQFPAAGYGPLHETIFPHSHHGPPEQVLVDRNLSISFIAALPDAEKDQVAARIRELISRTPALAGKAEVTYPYQTHAYHCVKEA
jgi:SAM-dependent methyltransferase